MKKIISLLLLLCLLKTGEALHITGGEVTYTYLGPGINPGTAAYRINIMLFRDENAIGAAAMPQSIVVGIYNLSTGLQQMAHRTINVSNITFVPLAALPNCISNPPNLSYTVGNYTFEVSLPVNPNGYSITYQTCCRIDNIENTLNRIGATYTAHIPGSSTVGVQGDDNSPSFAQSISVICYNRPFTLDFSATDSNPDDSLVYKFCAAFDGGAASAAAFSDPAGPPYSSIPYINGFSGISPLGSGSSIDPNTGIISGIAPGAGRYVVSVCVDSYSKTTGLFRATHRKDFIVTVAPCDIAGAQLNPSYISCDGFTFNFSNLNSSPLNQTYFWDFGDGNTSTEPNPVHTYANAGIYELKLVVNRGDQCGDSTTSQIRVFPGYFPSFTNMSPVCNNVPVQFTDGTTANYGIVNGWKWDFGVQTELDDTSRLQNPTYIFTTPDTYTVRLIVSSSVGCIDTIENEIEVLDKAPYTLTNDTLICNIDTLQLNFTTANPGTISWTPNYMISNVSTANPLVSPDVSTTYYVSYTDNFGCSAFDSVRVNVVDRVTLNAMGDTTICLTDSLVIRTNSDALLFTWTPPATILDNTIQSPTVVPVDPVTNYHVIGRIGKCFTEDDVVVRTVPYPVANAGVDTTICFGDSYQLTGSGGSIYNWTPRLFLTNSSIPNPVSQQPLQDIQYVLEVRDVLGCPKPTYDTMLLHVAVIVADAGPADTNVVLGQPLQLVATGSDNYMWSPATWLNNPTIFNPVSMPQESIQYIVRVSNDQGCFDTDTINVRVFNIDPDLLVPTAFSPDNDGLNDIFRPIVIGMKSLDKFRVYNRWGQLLFATTLTNGHGWDGTFKGAPQSAGTYVWEAEGVTYLDRKIKRKGTVILIR